MTPRNHTTSLFILVEAMQRSLESRGLDTRTVDDAVTRWLASLPQVGALGRPSTLAVSRA